MWYIWQPRVTADMYSLLFGFRPPLSCIFGMALVSHCGCHSYLAGWAADDKLTGPIREGNGACKKEFSLDSTASGPNNMDASGCLGWLVLRGMVHAV